MFPDLPTPGSNNGTIPRESRSGWVLVGGRSSRMGFDKALVELDGRPLALRIAETLAPFCASVSLVGDPAVYARLGLPVIPDSFPGHGPLAGIEAALRATSADANLIVACDMPALGRETFEALLSSEAADCVIPRYPDGRLEPLCAVYRRRCHPHILAALESGVRKVTDALRPLAVTYVPVASAQPFANLNTPEDLHIYRSRTRHG